MWLPSSPVAPVTRFMSRSAFLRASGCGPCGIRAPATQGAAHERIGEGRRRQAPDAGRAGRGGDTASKSKMRRGGKLPAELLNLLPGLVV